MAAFSGKNDIRLLLFDLGGVLVYYDPIEPLAKLVPGGEPREAITRQWANLDALRRLETGQIAPAEFAAAVVAEFGLRLTPAEFLDHFAHWDRGPMAGAVELLRSLRTRHRLACLSNNNPVHWSRLRTTFGMDRLFDATYLSHEIGVMKPDRRAYQHVLAAEGVRPETVIFIDDNNDNVAGARAAGLCAFQCVGIDAAHSRLAELLTNVPGLNHGSRPT